MRFLVLICVLIVFSCNVGSHPNSNVVAVETYYEGINTSNFELIRSVLADSLVLTEGDYVVPFSRDEFHRQFQWDSVFTPAVTLSDLRIVDSQVIASVSTSSPRFAFLENDPLTCETTFSFVNGKIRSLETGDCPDANWHIWESRRDTLVAWIDQNHQELSGFIHDLSKSGAENYLTAIQLYENK